MIAINRWSVILSQSAIGPMGANCTRSNHVSTLHSHPARDRRSRRMRGVRTDSIACPGPSGFIAGGNRRRSEGNDGSGRGGGSLLQVHEVGCGGNAGSGYIPIEVGRRPAWRNSDHDSIVRGIGLHGRGELLGGVFMQGDGASSVERVRYTPQLRLQRTRKQPDERSISEEDWWALQDSNLRPTD
jgi:hypothetical protein